MATAPEAIDSSTPVDDRSSNDASPLDVSSWSVVILSRGDRPTQLDRAIASIRRQRHVDSEVVVVWNGASTISTLQHIDRELDLPDNLGIPAARNRGVAIASNGLVLFLDDDAELVGSDLLHRVAALFGADRGLGIVALRIVDEQGSSAQRHVPRVGGIGPARPGPVTSFLGGAVAMRRDVFVGLGGYEPAFFYAMEETDLAWRAIDRGVGIWYAADLVVRHPRTEPTRHVTGVWNTSRNRAWIAHRSLPAPLAAIYSTVWLLIGLARGVRRPATVMPMVRGMVAGWRQPLGPRAPVGWRTVAHLTKLGRPPVI